MCHVKPKLLVTIGDVAGIGPEVALRALADAGTREAAELAAVGDRALWAEAASRLGLPVPEAVEHVPAPGGAAAALFSGQATAEGGTHAAACVRRAAELALAGEAGGLVTAPLSKQSLALAGERFPGHTEMLAEFCDAAGREVMMLVGGPPGGGGILRVALVTTHAALAEVPRLVTTERVEIVTRTVEAALREDFGLSRPRVAVLALNPHASDGGRFGSEEAEVLSPAIERLRGEGLAVEGPCVPDVTFHAMLGGAFDVIVAMYHDQGLGPLKTVAFDTGVNVTLGLPLVRTSPDHGTAFDIASRGEASARSMLEAIALAGKIAARRAGRTRKGAAA